jgi:hypothetical protein
MPSDHLDCAGQGKHVLHEGTRPSREVRSGRKAEPIRAAWSSRFGLSRRQTGKLKRKHPKRVRDRKRERLMRELFKGRTLEDLQSLLAMPVPLRVVVGLAGDPNI